MDMRDWKGNSFVGLNSSRKNQILFEEDSNLDR